MLRKKPYRFWPVWLLAVTLPLLLVMGWSLGRLAVGTIGSPISGDLMSQEETAELKALRESMEHVLQTGELVTSYLFLYRDQVAPVERTLLRRGVEPRTARQTAWPLVAYASHWDLDPAMVLAILLLESGGHPHATSPVGARGLMQVMPGWAGVWNECGDNLYAIDDNLCNGAAILAFYLNRHPEQHRALLAYNGCVRGTNTPNCFSYPDQVIGLRRQILREWAFSPTIPLGAAASP